jgi:hypothetical protein
VVEQKWQQLALGLTGISGALASRCSQEQLPSQNAKIHEEKKLNYHLN